MAVLDTMNIDSHTVDREKEVANTECLTFLNPLLRMIDRTVHGQGRDPRT
jgi:hypothetical protein